MKVLNSVLLISIRDVSKLSCLTLAPILSDTILNLWVKSLQEVIKKSILSGLFGFKELVLDGQYEGLSGRGVVD